MEAPQLILSVLGWCTLINMGMLIFATVAVVLFEKPMIRFHQKCFSISDEELRGEYFRYLANYKILTLIFNLVPYLSLWIALS